MRRSNRSGAWLGLACLLPIAAMGCQGIIPKAKPKPLDTSTALKGDATGDKTPFRPEVGADQQVNVHLDLARSFEIQGNFEAAVVEYQKAVDACSAPGAHRGDHKVTVKLESLAQRRMGGALDRMGRFAQAEAHYRAALKVSPNDANVWNDAGYSHYLQNHWADAERSLLTAAKLDPENPRIQTNLGLAFAAQDKLDAALAALSKAGGPAVAHANLGYILAEKGKPEEARKQYEAALEIQPQFDAARFALAKLEGKLGVQAVDSAAAGSGPALIAGSSAGASAPSEVVASEPIVLGTPPVSAPSAAAPASPVATPIVVPTPISVTASPAVPSPSVPAVTPAAPRRALSAPMAASPRPVRSAPIVSTPRALAVASRTRIDLADAKPDLTRALASTGIPLPVRRAASGSTSADGDLNRASVETGIPLPSRPAPAMDGPRP